MNPKPERPRSPTLRVVAVLVLLICLAILGTLGTWQSVRFLDRRDSFATMEARQAMDDLELRSASALTADVDYRNVRLVGGELLMERTAVVERRFHKHLPGNWTLTPYRFADGSVVIVHTGWVPETQPESEATPPAELRGIIVSPGRTKLDDVARADATFKLVDRPHLGELDAEFLYGLLDDLVPPPRRDTIVVLIGPQQPLVYPAPSHDHITKPYLTPAVHFGYAALWYGSALLMMWLFWAGWTGRLDPSAR